MLILLQDAARWPAAFAWFGAIPADQIEDWLRRNRITLPSDLFELWGTTGGGDAFESETILRPTVPSLPNGGFVSDDIESFNEQHAASGKPSDVYIFQGGAFLSAVRLHDQQFVTLAKNYLVKDSFPSLDEWYVGTLRAEFGPRYGLAPVQS